MEQTPFELTPQQKGLLATLSRETGKPIPALLDAALEALQEHERLPETVHDTTVERPKKKHLWEVAADLLADVPQEVFDKLPVDGAAQHDHYIYGTPKRTP